MPESVRSAADIWQTLRGKRGPELLQSLVEELVTLHQLCGKLGRLVQHLQIQQAISDFYATQSGVWRAATAEQLKRIAITIDDNLLRRQMRRVQNTISLFDDWLAGCRHLRITYEALYGPSPAEPLQQISRFLDIDEIIPFRPGFVKTTPPYEECIVNSDEIKTLETLGQLIGS